MTKKIRIENADTSHYPVRVRVMDKSAPMRDDVQREVRMLRSPTDQCEVYIHSGCYVIIDEYDPEASLPGR